MVIFYWVDFLINNRYNNEANVFDSIINFLMAMLFVVLGFTILYFKPEIDNYVIIAGLLFMFAFIIVK